MTEACSSSQDVEATSLNIGGETVTADLVTINSEYASASTAAIEISPAVLPADAQAAQNGQDKVINYARQPSRRLLALEDRTALNLLEPDGLQLRRIPILNCWSACNEETPAAAMWRAAIAYLFSVKVRRHEYYGLYISKSLRHTFILKQKMSRENRSLARATFSRQEPIRRA